MADIQEATNILCAYYVQGTVGNVGMPGAPIMHFKLVVVPCQNSVSGMVEITQAIAPPNSSIVINNVTGTIRATGFGGVTHVVALQGSYLYTLPPPAIGSILEQFSAHLAINNNWDGMGGFSYGNHNVENVPVNAVQA